MYGLSKKKVSITYKFIHFKLQLPNLFHNQFIIIDPTANLIILCSKLGIQTSILIFKTGFFVVVLSI